MIIHGEFEKKLGNLIIYKGQNGEDRRERKLMMYLGDD